MFGVVDLLHSCCAIIGCWITDPLNKAFGRKKTIFITCSIRYKQIHLASVGFSDLEFITSFITCIWSAVTNTWWHLFIARFFLGFGIGYVINKCTNKNSPLMSEYLSPKSATVPVYSAECSPAVIRGALVMMVSRVADDNSST